MVTCSIIAQLQDLSTWYRRPLKIAVHFFNTPGILPLPYQSSNHRVKNICDHGQIFFFFFSITDRRMWTNTPCKPHLMALPCDCALPHPPCASVHGYPWLYLPMWLCLYYVTLPIVDLYNALVLLCFMCYGYPSSLILYMMCMSIPHAGGRWLVMVDIGRF